MKRRRVFFFCELLSFLRPRLFSPPVFVSLLVWAIPRARSYQVVYQLDLCGSIVYPCVQFWDLILDIWKRAIPIHSSEGKTSPSSFEYSFCMWSEALSMLVLFSLVTSTCLDAMRKVVASGTYNFCSMYFVMARCDIFTYASKTVSRFLRRKWCPLLFFTLLLVSTGGHFAAETLGKTEEFERAVCTRQQQLSFLCNFLVLKS